MGMLEEAGRTFGVLMVFLVLGVFAILALAIGYDKGWAIPIDSWGMPLDVIFVTVFLLFVLAGLFVSILRNNPF